MEQPWLRPPTQEYIEKQASIKQPSVCASMKERAASRLFETMANEPEPTDLSKFYKGMPSSADLALDESNAKRSRIALLLLSGAQAVLAFVAAARFTQAEQQTTAEDEMLRATILLIGVSGVLGFLGALRWWPEALQLFFISQIWGLSMSFSQFLAQLQAVRREAVFCEANGCGGDGSNSVMVIALAVALVAVYVSMFLSDGISEYIQDKNETEDNQHIVQFVWTMNKKTLLGIHRFEELIHAEFEKLVSLGFLKLKAGD